MERRRQVRGAQVNGAQVGGAKAGRAKGLLVAALSLALAAGGGCASLGASVPRGGKPAMSDVQFRLRDFRLQNGMRILVEEDHASPLVGVVAVVGVGSSGDPQGREGLAHLLEHLAFRSRPGGGPSAWAQLETAGVGNLNATTSLDATTYFELGSRDLLPRLLSLEAGRLLDPLAGVDQKTFDVEREVVRNELRQRGENEIGPAFNHLQEAVFPPGHRYARPPIGTHQSLSAITLEDARKFAAQHYVPANITLVVIGDVDLPNIQLALGRALPPAVFQPLPPTQTPFPARITGPAKEPPAPPAAKLVRHAATVASPELYLVWSLPRAFDTETVMLDFVTQAARRELSQAFWADRDIVGVSVFRIPGAEASMLVARVVLKTGEDVERSSQRVLDQLVHLWASGEAGSYLDRADAARSGFAKERALARLANRAVVGMMLGAEDLLARGLERAESTHFSGDPVTYSRRLRAMGSITGPQVTHFAETYLQRDRARAVLLEPFAAGQKVDASGPTGLEPVSSRPPPGSLSPAAVRQLGRAHLERGNAEAAAAAASKAGGAHREETLDNGLRVLVHRRQGAMPVVVASLTFAGGAANATPPGAGELAEYIGFPKGHVQGEPGDFGIWLGSDIRRDHSSVAAVGADGNVANLLAQLWEQASSMGTFDAAAALFRREYVSYLTLDEQLPLKKGERALQSALFSGHPLGETPSAADLAKLGVLDVGRFFREGWTPRGAVLVVAGDLDPAATMAEVRRWFGPWSGPAPFPDLPPPTIRSRPLEVVVTHQPGATQAQVHLACLAQDASAAHTLSGRTAAELLALELHDALRTQLGASYGFGGGAAGLPGEVQRLDWEGSIENARLAQGLAVLADRRTMLETQGFTDQALERARWAVARQLTVAMDTTTEVTAAITRRALARRPTTNLENDLEVLAALGKDQVLGTWRQCKGSMVLSLVGDQAVIRDALDQAGL